MSSSSETSSVRAREHTALVEEVEGASGRGTTPEPCVSETERIVWAALPATTTAPGAEAQPAAPIVETDPELAPLTMPELRTGVWTRFGASSVLGDAVTEETLSSLAENARTAARSQGYAVGWAEGRRAARETADAEARAAEAARIEIETARAREHAAAVAALELAAARLHEAVAGLCAAVEEQATGLACELTEELLGHELRSVTGTDVVRRALQLAPTEPIVRLHVHPDHVAELSEAERAELAEHATALVADPALAWGDALVETADHVVDLRFRTALERVREVLA